MRFLNEAERVVPVAKVTNWFILKLSGGSFITTFHKEHKREERLTTRPC